MEKVEHKIGLGEFFRSLQKSNIAVFINKWFYTPYYVMIMAFASLLGATLGAEVFAYTVIIAAAVFSLLFAKDFLPTVPVFISAYITPNFKNNPGVNPDSVFSFGRAGIYLTALVALLAIALVIRLATDKRFNFKKLFTEKRKLTYGFAAIVVAFLLSGIFSKEFSGVWLKNLIYVSLLVICFAALYFLYTACVEWNENAFFYLLFTGMILATEVVLQTVYTYFAKNVILNGRIDRSAIYTGWGNNNNIGAFMAFLMPCAFALAALKEKNSWVYNGIGNVIFLGIILTQSRGSILTAAIVYVFCAVLVISKGHNKIQNAVLYAAVALAGILVIIVFFDKIVVLMGEIIDKGLHDGGSGRVNAYKTGMQKFLSAPIFGTTFYSAPSELMWNVAANESFNAFMPARWHNTAVQILASAGLAGAAAYIYHRTQTVLLVFKKPSVLKWFLALCVLSILGTSLVDCHLFNFAPTFIYSILLAFIEKSDDRDSIHHH